MIRRVQKILMTADTLGGVWTYTLDLLEEFSRRQIETVLVSQGRTPSPDQSAALGRIGGVTLVPTPYKLEWMDDSWSDVDRCGRLLLDIADDFRPDIVHLNGYAHASLPFEVPSIAVAHSCVLSWWRAVKREAAPEAQWSEYRARVQAGLQRANLIVAPTQAMLDMLSDEYLFYSPTKVIHNGASSLTAVRHGVAKEPVIFTAGRVWDEAKNISILRYAARWVEAPIYIAGEQSDCPEHRYHAPRTTMMLGQISRDEVLEWMERAAIYCAPARYEPFGLSILEAAQAKCALVLGDIATLRELWDGDCALFVDPHRPEEIARAINKLLADDALRTRLQQNAYVRSKKYAGAATAEAYLKAYNVASERLVVV